MRHGQQQAIGDLAVSTTPVGGAGKACLRLSLPDTSGWDNHISLYVLNLSQRALLMYM
jgi:hypothetical protein